MRHLAGLLAPALLLGCAAWASAVAPPPRKLPDGVYAVRRDGLKKSDVLPLRGDEALVTHRHRFLKKDGGESPRFVVVGTAPEVKLDLDGEPKAIKGGAEMVGVLLKLRPKAAGALERLTGRARPPQVAIVIGAEVVTIHKVRGAIKGGQVQITNCAPGAAAHLLERLRAK